MSPVLELRSAEPIAAFDVGGRMIAVNEAFVHFTGIPREEALVAPCWELVGAIEESGALVCRESCPILAHAARGLPVPPLDVLVRSVAGPRRASLSTVWARCGAERVLFHLVRAARPVTDVAAWQQLPPLSARQQEVLRLLAAGLSTRAIADRLVLSPETVRNHVRRLLHALGCRSRLEAVALAYRLGLV